MISPNNLPHPSAADLHQSQQLISDMINRIAQQGPMRFYDFMQLALYHPTLGYYRSQQPFGKKGDFITAAHCGPWFAKALAAYCAPIFSQHPDLIACEFGAGNGQMALDLLKALQEKKALPKQYAIIETSPALQHRQQQMLMPYPALSAIATWPSQLPQNFSSILIANEVLDAMPFHIFRKAAQGYEQLFVAMADGKLTPCWQQALDPIPDAIMSLPLENGHCFEVNPHLTSWLTHAYEHVDRGLCFLIDYGVVKDHYFSRAPQGYARAFYRHHVHDDLILYPGLQDITTHVDFSALADAALESGWEVLGFTNQANFLLQGGATEMALPGYDTPEGVLARTQLKTLMLPQEMGETFKVMVLSKDADDLFEGFMHDQRHRL